MFHHPQNIPSIIRTQRLMEQQEYSIIIRRPKEQIHWRRTRFHQSSGPKGWWNNKNIPSSSEDPKRRFMMKERIFHHHHHHHLHHHQRWSRLQRSVPPLSLWFEVFENPWSSITTTTTTTIWSFCWLFGWLNPHDFGWNFFVFLWELMAMKVCCKSLWYATWEIEREREREQDPPHPKKLQIVIVGLGFVNEH